MGYVLNKQPFPLSRFSGAHTGARFHLEVRLKQCVETNRSSVFIEAIENSSVC